MEVKQCRYNSLAEAHDYLVSASLYARRDWESGLGASVYRIYIKGTHELLAICTTEQGAIEHMQGYEA